MPAGLVSRTWRSYLRLSLRGVIALVLVVGVWLGSLGGGARVQHEAVAAITRVGGRVAYDSERKDQRGVVWVRKLDLSGTHVTVAGLVQLNGLTKLSVLNLGGTQVTRAEIIELKRFWPGLRINR